MKTLKTVLISAISATCLFGFSQQVLASTVRQVSVELATGTSGQPLRLGLAPGYGLNISFIPTGETVEKVWLDDPSWVTVDVDGCLQGLSNSNCDKPGASVLHLRRIQTLNFSGLSRSPSGSSLLTVVTRGSSGRPTNVNQNLANSDKYLQAIFSAPTPCLTVAVELSTLPTTKVMCIKEY